MKKKCSGCGAIFQSENVNLEGYVKLENYDKSKICERCFRIINYNEYQVIQKSNDEFINILKKINETNDLVVLVIDLLNINKDLKEITKYLDNDVLAVYTKRDLLPLLIKDEKLLNYNLEMGIEFVDSIVISSNKNYNLDLLMEKINKYKKSKNVYVVGYSNTGKSTLINKIIYNYFSLEMSITTSMLPSTTIDMIKIELSDELTLIDTPGILERGSIVNLLDGKTLKKILPKREIKPITYQVKEKQYIFIDSLAKLVLEDNNLTFYMSNNLKIERVFKDRKTNLRKTVVHVKKDNDIVITGLGFIKVSKDGVVSVYTLDGVDVYTRKSLI
ncbi:MAG: 50S ribosome-binding GTPase [Bacilli bacterium]|nr:50S ribosome-binding GTPase [Bacilli bacterium]